VQKAAFPFRTGEAVFVWNVRLLVKNFFAFCDTFTNDLFLFCSKSFVLTLFLTSSTIKTGKNELKTERMQENVVCDAFWRKKGLGRKR
jgi:hypothetical protein